MPKVQKKRLERDEMSEATKRSQSKFSFIYGIKRRDTGRTYIGSTDRKLRVRWLEHQKRLRNNQHLNPFLQADYNQLGLSAFRFFLVEKVSRDQVEEREQYWADHYRQLPPGVYNTGTDTATPFAGRSHDLETRAKIRETLRKTRQEARKARISKAKTQTVDDL